MHVSKNCLVKRRMATPSNTRPVRPMRCFAEAWDTHEVIRQDMCLDLSYTIWRRRPKSMTTRTFGIVSEDSAMFEARITWTVPEGGSSKTAPSCSSLGMSEWSAKTLKQQSGLLTLGAQVMCCSRSGSSIGFSVSYSSDISPIPGMKTRIPSPGVATRSTSS